jgi:hypothetical protein
MVEPDVQRQRDDLVRKAQAQPGINELMRAYGRYDEVMEQSRAYVEGSNSLARNTVSNRSA